MKTILNVVVELRDILLRSINNRSNYDRCLKRTKYKNFTAEIDEQVSVRITDGRTWLCE